MALNTKQFMLWVEKEHPNLTLSMREYYDKTNTYPSEWEEHMIAQYQDAKNKLLQEEIKKKYKNEKIKKILSASRDRWRRNRGRKYMKTYVVGLADLELDITEEGILSKLERHLLTDGSGRISIKGVSSVNSLSKFLGVAYKTLDKKLKGLESKNIVKLERTGKNTEIFLNPLYIMYGEEIDGSLMDMFDLPVDEFTKL